MKQNISKKYSLILIVFLVIVTIGLTYSFFANQGNVLFNNDVNVTSNTTDLLTFQIDNDIDFEVSQQDFVSGGNNKSGYTNARAILVPNNKTGNATMNYYMYLNIEDNPIDYSSTNTNELPELMLQLYDGNNELVTIDYLDEMVTVKGVTGYDITGFEGLIPLLDNHEIVATNNNQVTQEWKVVVTFINLDINQNDNTGKELIAEVIMQKDPYTPGGNLSGNLAVVIKNELTPNNLMKEYRGEGYYHAENDKDTEHPYFTRPIYFWDNSLANVSEIKNRWNVLFGDICWQIIRTTENGGIKLLYNGEPDISYDYILGKLVYDCSTGRSNHIGYGSRTTVSLNSSTTYWFSTGYTFENNHYSLDGEYVSSTWNENNSANLSGLYTCLNTDKNATCNTMYLIDTYNNATSAYVFPLGTTANTSYNLISNSIPYNIPSNSPAYMGYMYNKVYNATSVQRSGLSENISTANNYYVSNDITKNSDLSFTFNNAILVNGSDWSSVYSSYSGYYICLTGTTVCDYSNIRYMTSTNSNGYSFWENVIFGKRVNYTNGHYVIDTSDALFFTNFSAYQPFNGNYHYTCFNSTGECEEVNYIFFGNSYYYMSYITLYGGKIITTDTSNTTTSALYDMLDAPDVNTKNSTIKTVLDSWYAANLIDYNTYIDDEEIYCQDRTIDNYNGWDNNEPVKSSTYLSIVTNSSYRCLRKIDSYSVTETLNGNGALTYPIGLITYGEASSESNLINNANYRIANPGGYYAGSRTSYAADWRVHGNLGGGSNNAEDYGVRPSIALKAEYTIYSSGDGSTTNPYLIDVGHDIIVDSYNFQASKTKAVKGETVAITNNKYVVGSFKINNVTVIGNTFIMPDEDVTITDIEVYKIKNRSNDNDVFIPNSGIPESRVTLTYDNGYIVKSFKLDGVLVNGDSFIMPHSDVIVSDITKDLIPFTNYSANEVFLRLNSRNYYVVNAGQAFAAYYYNGTWTHPIVVGRTPESVVYRADDGGGPFNYTLTVTYKGATYYVAGNNHSFPGAPSDTSGKNATRYVASTLQDAALMLLEDKIG